MEHAYILSIGTELALGQAVDTNSAWIARALAALGIRSLRHETVADELPDIRAALHRAARAAKLVLVTGGLGPTQDDLTRQALADALGVPLEPHAESLAQIRAFFERRKRVMPEVNQVQALCPRGARPLSNPSGTAPGIHAQLEGADCYLLPGVPSEMKTMFQEHVLPELRRQARGAVLVSRRLQCYGAGESEIGERIADLMQRGRNPEVGTTAELGVIGIRINARASSAEAAEQLLDQQEGILRERLGELVFGSGEETLAAAVGRLLQARGQTLATAESCTGGLLAAQLTDVPGSSAYFRGGLITYSNELKTGLLGVAAAQLAEHGAVSGPVAHDMAVAARLRCGVDYALGLTGIAGPTGGTDEKPIGLVYLALAGPAGVQTRELRLGSDASRYSIRMRACGAALNLLRLHLLCS